MEQIMPWGFGILCLAVLVFVSVYWGKKIIASKPINAIQGIPKKISLQVPENVNLVQMSAEEIEALALDLSKKATKDLPKGSSLLGIEKVTLTNTPKLDWGVWGEWSRACGSRELPGDIIINPEIFEDPINPQALDKVNSSKVIMENKSLNAKK
jgi:hypothetical protein